MHLHLPLLRTPAFVLIAALLPAGCSELPTAEQSAAERAAAYVPAALALTPAPFDFGSVEVGQTASQQFTLANTGGSASGRLTASLAGSSAYAIVTDVCSATSLGPRKSCTVTVEYTPAAVGQNDAAVLNVISNLTASASAALSGLGDWALTDVLATSTHLLLNSCGAGLPGRTCETLPGSVIADAFRFTHAADFGLMNSGAIRADLTCPFTAAPGCEGAPPLSITRGRVGVVLPFGNKVVTLPLNGAELKTMLEHSVSQMPNPAARFLQVSGLCFTADVSAEVGSRVIDVVRQAADGSCTGPIVDLTVAATYVIATIDFIAGGGEGYPDYTARMTTHGLYDLTVSVWLAQQQSPISPTFQGRIIIAHS